MKIFYNYLYINEVLNQISKKLEDVSDTQLVAAFLEKTDGNILNLLTIIEGPYSFIYYNQNQKLLWFGRDPLGRHSLLWKLSCKELLVLSVGHKKIPNLREIPASGIFCLHLDKSIPSNLTAYFIFFIYGSVFYLHS